MVRIEWFGVAIEATWGMIALAGLLALLVFGAIAWLIVKVVGG